MNLRSLVPCRLAYGRIWLAIAILILAALGNAAIVRAANTDVPADSNEQAYQKAIEQARQGHFTNALQQLENLISANPDNRRYYFDYIAVLGWAERDQKVIDQLPRIEVAKAPVYVLETVAKSARNLGRFQLSVDLYSAALKKDARRIQSRAGLAMSLADDGRVDEGLSILDDVSPDQSDNIDLQSARAYVLDKKRDYFSALGIYEAILKRSPENRQAQRGRILTVAHMGAPHQALRLAGQSPGLLADDELSVIEADAIALEIRWGRLRQGTAAQRYVLTDEAINKLQSRLKSLEDTARGDSALAHRYRFDLIVALVDRHRMDEALVIHEQLVSDGVAIPAYVQMSAADAYLYLEQPEQARDLYQDVLRLQPGDFDATIGLFYTYVELEEHQQAQALIDELVGLTPVWIRSETGEQPQPNPQRVEADITAALSRAFADDLETSSQTLAELNRQAPHNADIRAALADVSSFRGWPRNALSDYELALSADRGHLEARTGHAGTLLDLYEFEAAEVAIQDIGHEYPLNKGVVGLQRQWQLYNLHELRFYVARGLNSGAQEGTDDLAMNAYLYSRPMNYHYRTFVHGLLDRAKFPEGNVTYRRYGAGLEYRQRDIELTGELTTGAGDQDDMGIGAQLSWMPDDYWRFDLAADSYSNDIPLRARLSDIDGWSVSLDTAYRFSESRRIDLHLNRIDFSDDNLRTGGTFVYTERLVTGPRYKLDGSLELSMSRNTRNNAPYFNPQRDSSQGLSLVNEWLTSRRYTRAFRQRLGLGIGTYHQADFGSRTTWHVRYEHDWELNDQFSLLYGISRSRHIYDGDSEMRSQIDLGLVWRF